MACLFIIYRCGKEEGKISGPPDFMAEFLFLESQKPSLSGRTFHLESDEGVALTAPFDREHLAIACKLLNGSREEFSKVLAG